ncbi:uncharacterized protein EDB91DRAFT_1101382 [Suillus paluster]|uniref:uncharacterized protein n=1 Tax=Suillus paluster TaxID=48578 RepID=UPI001B876113|nr:uncharacterized protein EDB91DRAFT_1101382 [Suillus paluster]KAG1754055.1 hypothetical protein EDB91DRAFT_1101382 [Suillus paluster]
MDDEIMTSCQKGVLEVGLMARAQVLVNTRSPSGHRFPPTPFPLLSYFYRHEMALFTDHPFRHVIKGILALAMGHLIMKMMPHSIQVIHLTQTSVTVLAIGALILLVVKHHRTQGEDRVLSQSQEELILIAALGAFWLAFLLAMRAWNQSSVDIDLAHPRHMFQASTGEAQSNVVGAGSRGGAAAAQGMPPAVSSERLQGAASYIRQSYKPQAGFRKPHPCNPNDAYCVVEEWTFY